MKTTALNAETLFEEINNNKIAYRTFGNGTPLFFVNRFRGIMDTWDPLFLDSLAEKNTIILFDYPGIGSSEGELPLDILEVAKTVPALADHLGIQKFNVLGWSYGGLVTQAVTFQNQDRVLKTVLIGTNPPGENAIPIEPVFFEHALKPVNDLNDEYYLFFEPASEKSRQAAKESHERIGQRLDRSLIPSTPEIFQRYFAGSAPFKEDQQNFLGAYQTLQTPVLVISGDHDISFATENWFPLLKNAPTMQHLILNDAGHGPQHQYPELTAGYINFFL
ncbi:pimeloyl-ACP methyl ester carboxylesterase [Chryseobacterium ginsenosidimutans]|uniref:alpha/beta fold hydrolase n=1 Tax=Chryseobacterium ginsenosidimutans TaxID=687846 RepID=UPI002781F58B|nr:alpha/beta hydrolase [Chryseobacterium ginsenosidimutans]MDQ0593640.1 pimeloyl-ACP methyl ester carboxylesterase [Chryseobacterium ginsenosidimutans]